MKLIAKSFALALALLSLPSCKSKRLIESEESLINSSALYTPTSVTSIKGAQYQFGEGVWTGTGENLYSQAAFTRALTIGRGK
jgi:hypothetical protein